MPSINVVVGASRGIGRELVKQLSEKPDTEVIAAMRNPSHFSSPKNNVKVVALDQTNQDSVSEAAKLIPEIDTLILNAAIGDDDLLEAISSEQLSHYLDTNVVGPHRVVKALLPALLLRKTRQIIYISSTAGSIQGQVNEKWGLRGPYAVTKAAGNMMAVQLHNELSSRGFTVVPVHPGWVATDMGNKGGEGGMSVEESAHHILSLVNSLTPADSAKFFSYDGTTLPW